MKTYRLLFLVAILGVMPATFTACSSAPSERVVQVQSLKAVGHAAEATVTLSAQLYRDGKISAAQARAIADFYDLKFQTAYRVAVTAANSDLNSLASPDVLMLASQLANLLASYQH